MNDLSAARIDPPIARKRNALLPARLIALAWRVIA
jgi:hypothetical protein